MTGRLRVPICVATVIAAACIGAPAAHASETDAVIVSAATTDAAARAVRGVGASVETRLDIVDAVATHVNATQLAALQANANVSVAPDADLHPTGDSYGVADVDTHIAALDPGPELAPDGGDGVAVALIDTGVADTPDLKGARLVRSPDFSGEGDGIDHYGHGTFMAGLIAGDGSASAGSRPRHVGVAPGATVVAIKVAAADGSSSVSRVIAGIGWAVTHRDVYDIRVMNLSFGVDVPMPYHANPLAAAAEAAWASGIVVVAAAGNSGANNVTSPGDDPYVITAGAADTRGTATTTDDVVPSWSGNESFKNYAKPEIVAPGVSVTSLRAPGSTIDRLHPEGRVGTAYFRGTGTSMSTALVTGAAALLVADHPGATPDDVKGALVSTAKTTADGAAAIDIDAADHASASPDWWQHYKTALGSFGFGLNDGMPWTASRWTGDYWDASRWTASRWTASRWTASRWTASRWTASRWTDADWSASRWTDTGWEASRWTASRWTELAWPSNTWG
jgi:serine protease AprX